MSDFADNLSAVTSRTQFTFLSDTNHASAGWRMKLLAQALPELAKSETNPDGVAYLFLEQDYRFQDIIERFLTGEQKLDALVEDFKAAMPRYGYGEYVPSPGLEAERAFADQLIAAHNAGIAIHLISPDRSPATKVLGHFEPQRPLNQHFANEIHRTAGAERAIITLGLGHLANSYDVDEMLQEALGADRSVVIAVDSNLGLLARASEDLPEISLSFNPPSLEVLDGAELEGSLSSPLPPNRLAHSASQTKGKGH